MHLIDKFIHFHCCRKRTQMPPEVAFGENYFERGNAGGTGNTGTLSGFGTAHTASTRSISGFNGVDTLCTHVFKMFVLRILLVCWVLYCSRRGYSQ